MYVKDRLNASIVEDLCVSRTCIETLGIKLNLNYTRPIYIIGVYRPPEQPVREGIGVLDALMDILYRRANFELNCIGDFNINLLKRNVDTRLLKEFMLRHGLKNLINSPTCYRANLIDASLIDLYLTTDEELYAQHGVCPSIVLDHYLIFAAREKFKIKHDRISLMARKYKDLSESKLIADLKRQNWDCVLLSDDPNVAWNNFVSKFTLILDTHAPYRKMWFDNNIPVWATRELLSEIKDRNKLTNKANKTKNGIDIWLAKCKRNYITSFKRNLKRNYFTNALEAAKDDPKKLWRILRLLVSGSKSKNKITSLNGHSTNEAMANEMNEFFANIGPKLAANIPEAMIMGDYSFDESRPVFEFTLTKYGPYSDPVPETCSRTGDKYLGSYYQLEPE